MADHDAAEVAARVLEDALRVQARAGGGVGGWPRGAVNLSKSNPSMLLQYAEKPGLNPYTWSGSVSRALLEELMATACIIGRT